MCLLLRKFYEMTSKVFSQIASLNCKNFSCVSLEPFPHFKMSSLRGYSLPNSFVLDVQEGSLGGRERKIFPHHATTCFLFALL